MTREMSVPANAFSDSHMAVWNEAVDNWETFNLEQKLQNNVKLKNAAKRLVLKINEEKLHWSNSKLLAKKLKEVIARGYPYIALDLAKVKWLNSSALGEIMYYHKKAKQSRQEIELRNVNDELQEIFKLLSLDKIFELS